MFFWFLNLDLYQAQLIGYGSYCPSPKPSARPGKKTMIFFGDADVEVLKNVVFVMY
jgi:hypothetical protein